MTAYASYLDFNPRSFEGVCRCLKYEIHAEHCLESQPRKPFECVSQFRSCNSAEGRVLSCQRTMRWVVPAPEHWLLCGHSCWTDPKHKATLVIGGKQRNLLVPRKRLGNWHNKNISQMKPRGSSDIWWISGSFLFLCLHGGLFNVLPWSGL